MKSAFRRLALRYHPDRNPDNESAAKQFRLIVDAYDAILEGPPPPTPMAARRPQNGQVPRPAPAPGRPLPPVPPPMARVPIQPRPKAPSGPRPLASLHFGETVWADYSAILVGPDRTCYLDPAAIGRDHVDRGTLVSIARESDGYYVVLPPGCRHRWSVSTRAAAAGLIVASIDVGEPPRPEGAEPRRTMPGRLLDATVARMEVGARGYTVATALVVDNRGHCFIDGTEHVNSSPTLTTPVRVERRKDGWHAFADGRAERWAEQGRTAGGLHIELTSATLGGVPVQPARAKR